MTLKQMNNFKIISTFNRFKDDPSLYTDCLQGGCAERTKIICEELKKQGEDVGYVLLPQNGWCDEKLSCKAKLKNGQEEDFIWIRHFVPFVFNEQNEAIVFDICLMDGPERFKDWKKYISYDGKPLKKEHYSLNHPDNVSNIDFMLKYRDPHINLASIASNYTDRQIIPNQIKSKWLAEQKLKLAKQKALFNLTRKTI